MLQILHIMLRFATICKNISYYLVFPDNTLYIRSYADNGSRIYVIRTIDFVLKSTNCYLRKYLVDLSKDYLKIDKLNGYNKNKK